MTTSADEYARLLRENHALIAQGKGDSPEAEALADRMDAPWHALTGAEQAGMRALSAALYRKSDALRVAGHAEDDPPAEE